MFYLCITPGKCIHVVECSTWIALNYCSKLSKCEYYIISLLMWSLRYNEEFSYLVEMITVKFSYMISLGYILSVCAFRFIYRFLTVIFAELHSETFIHLFLCCNLFFLICFRFRIFLNVRSRMTSRMTIKMWIYMRALNYFLMESCESQFILWLNVKYR